MECSECLMTVVVKDSNGAELKDGDSVTLIK
ncbi:MAG: PhnA domain-containing protein, partial [Candidatus Binatia bacterium]